MKNKKLLLVLGTILLASCNGNITTSSSQSPSNPSSSSSSTSEVEFEEPDYSNLAYIDNLEDYKIEGLTANWIWDSKSIDDSYVAFRKSFNLSSLPETAETYISAESKFFLWINGKLAIFDGSLKRGPTLYDSYIQKTDLKEYLQVGENVLAFLVINNGRGGNSSLDPGQAGLFFEMDLGDQKIISDDTFLVQRRKEYRNKSLLKNDYPNYPQSSMLAERNVYFDAREIENSGSFSDFIEVDYDDSSWKKATIICQSGEAPFNDFYLSDIPNMSFSKDYVDFVDAEQYLNYEFSEDTIITLSLPENCQFSPYFELEADEGKKIVYYTDTFESQGMGSFKDTYVTNNGLQKYESYPWRSGNQMILEIEEGITLKRVAYRLSSYPSERSGSFVSDDESINTLWEKAQNTLLICMRDSYMDCPDRERSPYLGDSANQVSMSFYALDRNSDLLTKKTILTLLGSIKTDNLFPTRSPSVQDNECPAQNLAFIVSLKDYYLNTGDETTLKAFYPALKNYLNVWTMDNSLPVYRTGSFPWSDWGNGTDEQLLQVIWYYLSLKTGLYFAEEFSISEDYSFYQERINDIESVFTETFMTENGLKSDAISSADDRTNALAIIAGLVSEEDLDKVINVLKTVEQASPYMEKYVLEALCLVNEYDFAKERMLRRYDSMIKDSGSTLFELWEKDEGTVNHGWTGGPLTVLSQYYLGLRPLTKGYETYEIRLQDRFKSLFTETDTVKGKISLNLETNENITSLTIDTISSEGYLYLPSSFGNNISIIGGEYENLMETKGYIVLKGGHYQITIIK